MGRILIVDDASLIRKVIRQALTKTGHEIVGEAVNGTEAVLRYKEFKPDLVTMDVTMKEKDGISAAKEIMSINKDAKIIMVTAIGQEHVIHAAVKIGVKDFVVKPFTEERLQTAVEKTLST